MRVYECIVVKLSMAHFGYMTFVVRSTGCGAFDNEQEQYHLYVLQLVTTHNSITYIYISLLYL